MDNGCVGDDGFRQPFDRAVPQASCDIVWKTHNDLNRDGIPDKGTLPIIDCVNKVLEKGYVPTVVVVHRDPYSNTMSAINRGYGPFFDMLYDKNVEWFEKAYRHLAQVYCKKVIISYDALVVYGWLYLNKCQQLLDFTFDKSKVNIIDNNRKHIRRRHGMKSEDGYELIKVERSGIPFYTREGTVDTNVLDEVIVGDPYQLNNITLRNNPNIVDVGAHIGAFTKLTAWKWPYAKHFAYEANPKNWEVLEMNLADIRNKVTLYKGALVGQEPTNKRLVINALEADRVTGGWGIIYSDEEYTPGAGEASVDIGNFYYLNDLWPALDKVDILKLDCEGSEFSILKHMTEEQLHKVDYLVCEIHCGALPHHDWTYEEFRAKILKQFICPELDARPTCSNHDLFNIVACNRKLTSGE
jgi:FkbM family methyltransferase